MWLTFRHTQTHMQPFILESGTFMQFDTHKKFQFHQITISSFKGLLSLKVIKWSFDNYRVIWKIQNNLTQPMAQLPTCMLFPRPAKSFYAVPCLSDICSACLLIALFYQSTPSCLKFIKWGLGGGGPCDFSVSPSPFGLDFGTLDFGTSDSGLTILGFK